MIAVFDTRTLPVLMSEIFSFAANKMNKVLNKQERAVVVEPEGFLVHEIKGPLLEGEEEKAGMWAVRIIKDS